jgi:hypothetical protein
MFAQAVLGSFMHVWDCASDVYVVWLWHTAGRSGLVAAGVLCILLSPLVTGIQGFNSLQRTATRRTAWLYAALSPLNVQNMVYGYLVLKNSRDKNSYASFTFLKGMHLGLQSMPLALMTGVDLLTGGAAVGKLVKITSLALSVFSICFTGVIYSCSVFDWGVEQALEVFALTCGDVMWLIMALGWTVGALSLRHAGLAIGVAYGVVWVTLYLFMTDLFAPHKVDKTFLEAILVPFRDAFGFRASLADDILARKRSVCWAVRGAICEWAVDAAVRHLHLRVRFRAHGARPRRGVHQESSGLRAGGGGRTQAGTAGAERHTSRGQVFSAEAGPDCRLRSRAHVLHAPPPRLSALLRHFQLRCAHPAQCCSAARRIRAGSHR